jgi:hypothetical protein
MGAVWHASPRSDLGHDAFANPLHGASDVTVAHEKYPCHGQGRKHNRDAHRLARKPRARNLIDTREHALSHLNARLVTAQQAESPVNVFIVPQGLATRRAAACVGTDRARFRLGEPSEHGRLELLRRRVGHLTAPVSPARRV